MSTAITGSCQRITQMESHHLGSQRQVPKFSSQTPPSTSTIITTTNFSTIKIIIRRSVIRIINLNTTIGSIKIKICFHHVCHFLVFRNHRWISKHIKRIIIILHCDFFHWFTRKISKYSKVNLARLGVSRTIYVNVDSPNLSILQLFRGVPVKQITMIMSYAHRWSLLVGSKNHRH